MENSKEMRTWLDNFGLGHPLVIAGPCSAETEEQVLKIAHELKESDVTVYRAGIWKPRTKPGMFEGVGAIGLKWLKKVKDETGLLTATEVASKNHVDLAIENDVDILFANEDEIKAQCESDSFDKAVEFVIDKFFESILCIMTHYMNYYGNFSNFHHWFRY